MVSACPPQRLLEMCDHLGVLHTVGRRWVVADRIHTLADPTSHSLAVEEAVCGC